jgi:membrane protease YdiL (CAAX protease family)
MAPHDTGTAYRYGMRVDLIPEDRPAVPAAPADRRTLVEEVLVVLALSLLASAAYAVLDLLSAPISGVIVAAADQSNEFTRQVLDFVFGLAPFLLVLHLVRRDGEGLVGIGLDLGRPRADLIRGLWLFLVVAAGGLAIYLSSVALGVNRFVVPVPPLHHWWTGPALLMNAAQAALLEEGIVLGYLVTRLEQIGWTPLAAVLGSAALRGSYHLYQGWGGFAGNFLMGLLFALLFIRWRRTWPFVLAHFLLDVGAGVGFILFHNYLPGFS